MLEKRFATQTCWQCLSRLRISPSNTYSLLSVQSASFSSTPLRAANPIKAKSGARIVASPARGGKTLNLGKKKKRKGATSPSKRVPAAGERRAFQKRIVISNTNAFEIQGIDELHAADISNPVSVGKMFTIPGPQLDGLRAIEAFRLTQGWRFFRRPTTLVRKETLQLGQHISQCDGTTFRRIIVGDQGCGKSVVLLQAQVMAFIKEWVVIHFPEGQDLANGHTAYAPVPNSSNPVKYSQKNYIAQLLGRIVKANETVLAKLTLTELPEASIPAQKDMKLAKFAELGAQDPEIALPVFNALWQELTSTSAKEQRPPILLTLDGLAHVSRLSEYLSPNMHHIHAHDLAIVDHFMTYLSGAKELPNGGMVLGAESNSNRPSAPALNLAIKQSESATKAGTAKPTNLPLYDPDNMFSPVDTRVLTSMRNVEVMRVPGLSKDEARTMLEYYAGSGLLRENVTETFVSEKWTVAGGGVIGELERSTLRAGL